VNTLFKRAHHLSILAQESFDDATSQLQSSQMHRTRLSQHSLLCTPFPHFTLLNCLCTNYI